MNRQQAYTALLKKHKSSKYDLAILDIKIPVKNRFGLHQETRKLDNKMQIYFLTVTTDVLLRPFSKRSIS